MKAIINPSTSRRQQQFRQIFCHFPASPSPNLRQQIDRQQFNAHSATGNLRLYTQITVRLQNRQFGLQL